MNVNIKELKGVKNQIGNLISVLKIGMLFEAKGHLREPRSIVFVGILKSKRNN